MAGSKPSLIDRILICLIVLAVTGGVWQQPQPVQASASGLQTGSEPGPSVLCLPGVYMYDPGDCLPAGPSGYLTEMAHKGITFPIPRLAYTPVDSALGQVKMLYGEVINMPAPVYASIDEAVKGNKKSALERLMGEFVYVSYQSEQQSGGKKLYEIKPGAFLTGNYLSRLGAMPAGRGITLASTPVLPFGWVLTYFSQTPQIEVRRYPNGESNGRLLNLYDIVQVFSEETVGEERWYLIGPDEWVQAKFIARVIPDTSPPGGVSGDRWIEVNLEEQTLAVYDRRQLVFATLIASGAEPFWTRPGTFQIYERHESAPMSGSFETDRSDAYYLEDVPFTMYYDGARALHGAYWRAKMGFEQSHGCVNLTVADAHWIFNWADIGDWVYVWDPSGRTPTDPELYKGGGY